MKFNIQLKNELKKYEKTVASENSATTAPVCEADQKSQPARIRDRTSEKVVGGNILWKPIDRAAAMLLAKAPWWAQPPHATTPKPEHEKKQPKPKKEIKHMVKHASELVGRNKDVADDTQNKWIVLGDYAIEVKGISKRTGEPLIDQIDMWPILLEKMNKMKHELTPAALAMIDGETALRNATQTAKDCMEETRSASKVLLDEVRQSKYAMVAEISAITTPLKELRQFFLGNDYKEQLTRLSEFVDLCERLQKLKTSGFLDLVADTMLRLAEQK